MLLFGEVLADDASSRHVRASLVEVAWANSAAARSQPVGTALGPGGPDATFHLSSLVSKDRLVEEPAAVFAHLERCGGGVTIGVTQVWVTYHIDVSAWVAEWVTNQSNSASESRI